MCDYKQNELNKFKKNAHLFDMQTFIYVEKYISKKVDYENPAWLHTWTVTPR